MRNRRAFFTSAWNRVKAREAAQWRSAMLAKMVVFGAPPSAQAPFRYEEVQARTHRCPAPERFLDGMEHGLERHDAGVLVLRAAARAGCARCGAVVAAGEVHDEWWLPWTIELARCAVALATYWLGRVLEAKGDTAGAKARLERFVSLWGAADLAIPEVADARRRLAAPP